MATVITFVIEHCYEDAINYKSNDRTAYFRSEYGDPFSAVVHFIDDYASAYSDCGTFESKFHDLARFLSRSSLQMGTNTICWLSQLTQPLRRKFLAVA